MFNLLFLLFILVFFPASEVWSQNIGSEDQFGPGQKASFDFFSPNAVRDPLRMHLEVSKQPEYSYFPSKPETYDFGATSDDPSQLPDSSGSNGGRMPHAAASSDLNGHSQMKDSIAASLFSEYGDPRERAPIKAIDSAPRPFKGLMAALESGREDIAALYARQYVNHIDNLQIRSNQIYSLANDARKMSNLEALTGDQEVPLRITSRVEEIPSVNSNRDGTVDLYFFFDPADDSQQAGVENIERLAQVTRGIETIRLVGMSLKSTLDPSVRNAIVSRHVSFLVRDGVELAKILHIDRFPVLALVSPASGEMHVRYDIRNLSDIFSIIRKLQGAA